MQNRACNTRPNNEGVPTPLDQPHNQEKPLAGVYLTEEALFGWCRLHKTILHSKLDFPKF